MCEIDRLEGFTTLKKAKELLSIGEENMYHKQQTVLGCKGLQFSRIGMGTAFVEDSRLETHHLPFRMVGHGFKEKNSPRLDKWKRHRQDDEYYIQIGGSLSELLFPVIKEQCFRCTRIDLKEDLPCIEYTIEELYSSSKDKLKREVRYLSSHNTETSGATLYIGARRTSHFVRIYEKDKQQGNQAGKTIRIEIQFNRQLAQPVYSACCLGDKERISVFTTHYNRIIEGLPELDLLENAPIRVCRPQKKDVRSDFEKYVNDQLLSRLRRIYSDGVGKDVMKQLIKHIENEMLTEKRTYFRIE